MVNGNRKKMPWWGKTLIAIFAVFLLLIVGIIIVLKSINLNNYKHKMSEVASNQLGKKVEVSGDFKFHFGSTVTLDLDKVAVSPVDGGKPLVSLDQAHFAISLWSLLFKTVDIKDITVNNFLMNLDKTASSKTDEPAVQSKKETSSKSDSSSPLKGWNILVDRASITHVQFLLNDRMHPNASQNFNLNKLFFHINTKKGMDVQFDAHLNQYPLQLNGVVAFKNANHERIMHADWNGNFAGIVLKFIGDLHSKRAPLEALVSKKMGDLNGTHMTLTVQSKDLLDVARMVKVNVQKSQAVPLNISLDIVGHEGYTSLEKLLFNTGAPHFLTVKLQGTVKDLSKIAGVSVDGNVATTDTRALATYLQNMGVNGVPLIKPVNVSFHVVDQKKAVWKTDVTFKTGTSNGKAFLVADLSKDVPFIDATVNADLIDIKDFMQKLSKGAVQSHASSKQTQKQTPLVRTNSIYPAKVIDLSGMKAVNANVNVAIKRLQNGASGFNNIVLKATLKDGVARLEKMQVGTQLDANATVDSTKDNSIIFNMKTHNLNLGTLLAVAGQPKYINAPFTSHIAVNTSGHTIKDFARFLNGDVNMTVGSGNVDLSSIAHKFSGVFANLLVGHNQGKAPLYCLVTKNKIKNGDLAMSGTVFDSGMSTLLAKGNVNLGLENLALQVLPVRVVANAQVTVPVNVGGRFLKPDVSLDVKNAVNQVASMLLGDKTTSTGQSNFLVNNFIPVDSAGCRYVYSSNIPKSDNNAVAKAQQQIQDAGKKASKEINKALDKGLSSLFG